MSLIKVDDIRPDLPGETLRAMGLCQNRIEWLENRGKR